VGQQRRKNPPLLSPSLLLLIPLRKCLHTYNLLILYFPKTLRYVRLQTFLRSSIMQHFRILKIVPLIPHKFVCLSCCYYWLQKIKIYCFRFDSGDITLYQMLWKQVNQFKDWIVMINTHTYIHTHTHTHTQTRAHTHTHTHTEQGNNTDIFCACTYVCVCVCVCIHCWQAAVLSPRTENTHWWNYIFCITRMSCLLTNCYCKNSIKMKNNFFNDRNVLNMVRISREVVTAVYRNEQTDRQVGS